MSVSPFLKSSKIFNNASDFTIVHHKVDSYVVDEFITESGRWFSLLNDDDDDATRQIRLKLWNLRSSVLESLLDYNTNELKLKIHFQELHLISQYNPNLEERLKTLSRIVAFMLDNPENPKKETVFKILNDSDDNGKGTAIVVSSSRMSVFQLNQQLIKDIKQLAPKCKLLLNRRMLLENTFNKIILPTGGRYCPFINDLYFGYLTSRLDIVTYHKERVLRPERAPLPVGSMELSGMVQLSSVCEEHADENETRVDTWAQKQFWESIRGSTQNQLSSSINEKDRSFYVKSRLILLAGGCKTFLQDDTKIIEISDLIEGRTDIQKIGKKYPRRFVNQLREGDLIVLRTSGSGNYLLDVSKALMLKAGQNDLHETVFAWKRMLRNGLETYGSERIASELAKKGFKLKNHKYIWMWTTDQVIRPHSIHIFYELIAVLEELDCSDEISEPLKMVDIWWKQMKDIIRFHMKAGQEIRNALLQRLGKMIRDNIIITDSCIFSLPDVDAGEMSIFRVTGVDSQTIDIPYYHTGTIVQSEVLEGNG
jgi:hypothetical protein